MRLKRLKKIKTNLKTAWVIGITMVILIILDIYMWNNGIPGDTISEITIRNAMRHPIIPFIWGVIMGHLFWPQRIYLEKDVE